MKKQVRNTLRDRAGFTLVELIVVIAILGILAGIGTVSYQGYIKKANLAADQQLLGAVNTAFAAACLENGVDVQKITVQPELTLSGTSGAMKVDSVSIPQEYDEAFQKYYIGNADAAFKVIENLIFDAEDYVFVDLATAGDIAVIYGGGKVQLNSEDIAKLANSTFITATDFGLGVNGLLDKVNEVATFAALFTNSNSLNQVFASPEFQAYAASAMGISLEGKTQDEIMNEFNDKAADLVQKMIASGKESDPDVAQQKLLANAAILFAANNAVGMDQSAVVDLLSNNGAKDTIIQHLTGYTDAQGNSVAADPGTAMSEAALAYGMYTAYAYSTGDAELIQKTQNPLDILSGLDDEGFQNYMKDKQGSTDLSGYLAALNMINNSTGDTDAVSSVLINGFDDPALKAILNQAVGQK